MQEMLDLAGQRLDQMARARRLEADHVDDDVGLEACDLAAERARLFQRVAVERDVAHEFPGAVRRVGLARAAADVGDVKAGGDEPRHEIRADMAAAADDDDFCHGLLLKALVAPFLTRKYRQRILLPLRGKVARSAG